MRKSRFTEEQTVAILREADRTTVAEAAKKHKVSEPTRDFESFDQEVPRLPRAVSSAPGRAS